MAVRNLQSLDGVYQKALLACSKELRDTAPPFIGLRVKERMADLTLEEREALATFRNWIKNVKEPQVVAIIEEYIAKTREKDRLCREKKRASGRAETEHAKYVRLHGMSRRSYEINKKLNESFPNGVPDSIPKYPFTTEEVEDETDVDLQFKRNLFIKHVLDNHPDALIAKFFAKKRNVCQNNERDRKREVEARPDSREYAEIRKRRRIEFREVFRARDKARSAKQLADVKYRVDRVKRGANDRNIEVLVSDEMLGEIVVQPCYYCGHHDETLTNGVDRLSSKEAYTAENIVPCCKPCNVSKWELDINLFLDMLELIVNHADGVDTTERSNALGKRTSSDYYSANHHAKNGCELTKEEFEAIRQAPCVYCGYSLTKVGVDRIDSSMGYKHGNVQPACHYCNQIKMTMSTNELIAKSRRILERLRPN